MKYFKLYILSIFYFLTLVGCSGGGGGSSGSGGSGVKPPSDSIIVPKIAYQDKKFTIDLSSYSSSTSSVSFQNGPSWLTYNSVTKKIEGVPNDNVNINNLSFTISKSDGSLSTFGPYSISVNGDPLRKYQWHIQNTGQSNFASNPGVSGNDINQIETIQSGISGNGVKVAVSDSGVEIAHEDLSANIIAGASKNYNLSSPYLGDPTPTSTTNGSVGHGTAVAGIIGSVGWNNIGTRGIAANVKIAGLRFIGIMQNTAIMIDQANGSFDIFNYSYGSPSLYPKVEDNAYLAQLRYGTTSQREGKGSFYVKSAGNEFTSDFAYDSTSGSLNCINTGSGINGNCHYFGNSNFGGTENSSTEIIIVGAINSKGSRASYSTPGSNLWVSAPGGEFGNTDPAIMTTDIQGCNKGLSSTLIMPVNWFENSISLNPNCKYTSVMNGTSSAAPITSGVIALILEANPALTWRDVKYILASTATKTDSTATSTSHPEGYNLAGYTYQQGWIQNAAGFWFHNWYGFGRVNTDNAVSVAKNYIGTFNPLRNTQSSDGTWQYSSGNISQAIPDKSATGTSSIINVRHNFIIEGIQVKFTTNHQWISDLGVELTSPSGTKSILMNINSGAVFNPSLTYTAQFLSNAFYGESSGGSWTLKVVDAAASDTGALTNWQINIIGHNNPNPSDTTPPISISNLTHSATYNSSTTSPIITWTGSISSDVLRYEISIGTFAGNTSILNWTSTGLLTTYQATGLSLTVGQTYYVNVRTIDTSENISTVVSSSGWLYTTALAPTLSISLPSILKMNSNGLSAYTVTYSGANTITLSNDDINLTQDGVSCSKEVSGSGTTTRIVTIYNCTGDGTVKISIASNTASNSVGMLAGSSGPSSIINIDNTAPSITGLSNDAIPTKVKTWNWGCNESPCTYRYVVDSNPVSEPTSIFSNVFTTSQASVTGTYYIHVQAQDVAGNISSVYHASVLLDNSPPIVTGLLNDNSWNTSKSLIWSCNKLPCTYRYLIDQISSTSPSSVYSTTAATSQSSGTGTYYIHVQAKDSLGNESVVSHYSFKLDNSPPTVPSSATLANSFSQSLTSTPMITFGISTDSESGIQKYQSRIYQVSNSILLKDWSDLVSGTTVSGISLITNTHYRIEVSALDNLNNRSTITSATWLVDATLPTTPSIGITIGSTPYDLNSSPTLTWNIPTDTDGSGISFYEVRLKKTSDSSIIQDWTTKVRGSSFSNLSLLDDTNYYFEIRATDNANNVSGTATSISWKTNYHYYQKISRGNQYTCGLTTLGSVKCWGILGNYVNSLIPKTIVSLEENVTDLSTGNTHICVVQNSAAKCFGYNMNGQLGDGTNTDSATLVSVFGLAGGVTKISAGDNFTCAIVSGSSKCWGVAKALGNGTTNPSSIPTDVVNSSSGVTSIEAGASHTCQIRNETVECWGYNGHKNIYGTAESYPSPILISEVNQYISAGNSKTCGINSSGAGLCWGYGGAIGNGSDSGTPTIVTTLTSGINKIFAGSNYAYAINSSGVLLGWGVGNIGNGSVGSNTPVVIISSGVINLSVGLDGSACALLSSNLVKCWGVNDSGQLGDGSTATRNTPTSVTNY